MIQLVMQYKGNDIARRNIDFDGLTSYKQRQEYLEKMARDLYKKHHKWHWRVQPVFFVRGAPSGVNELELQEVA